MTIHKLSAGSGYDYLTRQVARHDATETGHSGLSSYYSDKGETPGQWAGSGLAGIEGLSAGDVVSAGQMALLFGAGRHPLGPQLAARLLDGTGATERDYDRAGRLGVPFPVYAGDDVSAFRVQVARRFDAHNRELGLPADHPIPVDERARIRTDVARALFRTEHGREPADEREIAGIIAKHSRPKSNAVAGFDLTFSPVKSVSTLWAVADRGLSQQIERAHQAAVKDALTFIEDNALFTRTGKGGIQQVETRGLVATAFTHRDSRAGDPDLHTHVAAVNKVQTHDGRWLSIDGRVLFKATVTASETYNTALEKHLAPLGLTFAVRPGTDPRKRPIREIVGVEPALNQRWSARRASIEARRSHLAARFQADHARPPTPVESIQLAQQATLETRDAKHGPRSRSEQRDTWRAEALHVLGGHEQLAAMVTAARAGTATNGPGQRVDAQWVQATADRILATVQESRSTWQTWHVRAEAQRRTRGTDVPAAAVPALVDALTTRALDASVALSGARADSIAEPAMLRRRDGASVYTVAGADLYTSTTVLTAERRLVATAGRTDGRVATPAAVDMALLESTANGVELNAGQATLVREMATCGARLQLAIAPAGAGKTTAMRALTAAWEESGGTVLGLAPSAAAAAALRTQAGTRTDTLAKLVWSLHHEPDMLPDWVDAVGPATLVLIDEAGMADTLSLDAAVEFITDRGGSVRLIGDDQQLAAIGAGGVLRDIRATHGALHLGELMRFTHPAEGAVSLALRDGDPHALGFYLDAGRVHVGDQATMTENVFQSWRTDRAAGLDAIMLAPTRDLVAELNHRARAHRLDSAHEPGPSQPLADGNEASPGDLLITRTNDRGLRMSSTDWVKNGDRWTVLGVPGDGTLRVQHTRNRRILTLPAAYVAESTELGYATTVHTAQGVSVDTMHGLATGEESRQQFYTMMTRGQHANHVYLQVVSDGDEHALIRPETVHPRTGTDLLENILARDTAPRSASTTLRELDNPTHLLGQAADRYHDALYVAAQDRLGPQTLHALDQAAENMVAGLTDSPAWPTLRAHLMLLAANGADPLEELHTAVASRDLTTAADAAAVLGWRLDDTGLRNAGPGPLPWVPAVPATLAGHPTWGAYLTARSDLVATLATDVAQQAAASPTPAWARQGAARPEPDLLAQIEVWRAANHVPDTDLRPTGPPHADKAPCVHQRHLRAQLAGEHGPAITEWGPLIEHLSPEARADTFAHVLAERLAGISRAGIDAAALLRTAAESGPLPDDHAAAALWWRMAGHLSPAVTTQADQPQPLAVEWLPGLADVLGSGRVRTVQASPWWPTLVTTMDHAMARGWSIHDLAGTAPEPVDDLDDAQAMIWRISILTDPPTETEPATDINETEPPEDLLVDTGTASNVATDTEWAEYVNSDLTPDPPHTVEPSAPTVQDSHTADSGTVDGGTVDADLAFAAILRSTMGTLEPCDAQIERMVSRAINLEENTTVPPARFSRHQHDGPGLLRDATDQLWVGTGLPHRPVRQRRDRPPARPPRVRPRRVDPPREPPPQARGQRRRVHRVGARHHHPRRQADRPVPRPCPVPHHRPTKRAGPRVRRAAKPHPHRRDSPRRSEVPEHAQHRVVHQRRPALRGHPEPSEQRCHSGPRRRPDGCPRRDLGHRWYPRRVGAPGHLSDRRTSNPDRRLRERPDRGDRRRPARANGRRTGPLAARPTQPRPDHGQPPTRIRPRRPTPPTRPHTTGSSPFRCSPPSRCPHRRTTDEPASTNRATRSGHRPGHPHPHRVEPRMRDHRNPSRRHRSRHPPGAAAGRHRLAPRPPRRRVRPASPYPRRPSPDTERRRPNPTTPMDQHRQQTRLPAPPRTRLASPRKHDGTPTPQRTRRPRPRQANDHRPTPHRQASPRPALPTRHHRTPPRHNRIDWADRRTNPCCSRTGAPPLPRPPVPRSIPPPSIAVNNAAASAEQVNVHRLTCCRRSTLLRHPGVSGDRGVRWQLLFAVVRDVQRNERRSRANDSCGLGFYSLSGETFSGTLTRQHRKRWQKRFYSLSGETFSGTAQLTDTR